MDFKDLGIIDPILKALHEQGYAQPTPIQEQAIPELLHNKDLLGCAQTGTGKTAAFSVPLLQQLFKNRPPRQKGPRPIRSLVVAPTRELALQINESISAYGRYTGLRNTAIYGGVKQGAQTNALRKGMDILVATPGRLLDLINQGFVHLDQIEYFVLDEADQMLDMGFIHDIRRIIKLLPTRRQSLFFSATMSKEIIALSKQILGDPVRITINPKQTTAERVEQTVYFVPKQNKRKLLVHLLKGKEVESALVFSRTKFGADKLVGMLQKKEIHAAAIHGNKSQKARQQALGHFKNGKMNVLVATDIAARGIDVEELSHVINFDLPNVPETYVHRIGRTGRANAGGHAVSFCAPEEKSYLRDIQKLIQQQIPIVKEHPFIHLDKEPETGQAQQLPNRGNLQKDGKPKSKQGAPNGEPSNAWQGKKKNRSRSNNRNQHTPSNKR